MAKILTRPGARNLTAAIDRIASVIQERHEVLGIDPKIAQDFAYRCDLISDAVETTAVINYPKEAEKAVSEIGAETKGPIYEEEADPDLKGQFTQQEFQELTDEVEGRSSPEGVANAKVLASFDANEIGEEVPGPLVDEPPDPQIDKDHFTQEKFHELSDLAAAGKLAAVLSEMDEIREAAVSQVQGYAGFLDQVRKMDDLSAKIEELKAEIEDSTGDLLKHLKDAEKDYKKAVGEIKKSYKDNLTTQGEIVISRKTALVEAMASFKVTSQKRSLVAVQADLLEAVAAKYGANCAAFVDATGDALREEDKTLRVAFAGFKLEERASRVASMKNAGMVESLVRFREWLSKGWAKMVQIAKTATSVVQRNGDALEKSHKEFMDSLKDVSEGKMAANVSVPANDWGFNLTA